MSSHGWSFSKLQLQSPSSFILKVDPVPPVLPYFEPRQASVRRPSIIPESLSLLGIAPEVRDQIWEAILKDIRSNEKGSWYERVATDYDGLSLVCRQVYHEISHYWRRSIITQHRLNDFLGQSFSLSKLQDFKSLSVEIPFNMPAKFFNDMANMLRYLSPFLEHLGIFFIGCDAYGTRTAVNGCGNKSLMADTRKLPIDGQGFSERHVLINVLSVLQNLRSLVVHNPNLPLLQSQVILHKPRLRKLYIDSDPRSSLHVPWQVHNCGRGLLIPVTENFPPVKELYISANAAIMSVQVVNKLNLHLEKLTWVCPDIARQTGALAQDYLRDTATILSGLQSNSRKIRTLKICIEGAIYESLQAYGTLIGAFRTHLPHLRSLRNLELHIRSKSLWFGNEVVKAIPQSLERLYLGEALVDLDDLLEVIEGRYFLNPTETDRSYFSDVPLASIFTDRELSRRDHIPLTNGALTFVDYQYFNERGTTMHIKELEDKIKSHSGTNCAVPDTDADTNDVDFIDEQRLANKSGASTDEARRMSLLKLNGRLLDRARNRHLARYSPGVHIPCRISHNCLSDSSETVADSVPHASGVESSPKPAAPVSPELVEKSRDEHSEIKAAIAKLKAPSAGEVRTNATLLRISGFKDDFDYFGLEKAAEDVFREEKVAKAEELATRTYPMGVQTEAKEHWMCPRGPEKLSYHRDTMSCFLQHH